MWASKTRNGESISQLKIAREIVLKGPKQKFDAAAWIDVKLHWIQAVQSGSMEGTSTVSRFSYCKQQKLYGGLGMRLER